MATEKVICVWLDETDDTDYTAWVVSSELIDWDARPILQNTTAANIFRLDQYPDAYGQAVAVGLEIAHCARLRLMESDTEEHYFELAPVPA